MKKGIIKTLVLAACLTVFFTVPAMAQEVTNPNTVIREEVLVNELTAHQAAVQAQVNALVNSMADKNVANAHAAVVQNQVKKYNRDRADNYLKYLDGVIYNLKETQRIKKEIVDNYVNLSKVNPAFSANIVPAQADYAAATNWVNFYTEYRKACELDLAARYPR